MKVMALSISLSVVIVYLLFCFISWSWFDFSIDGYGPLRLVYAALVGTGSLCLSAYIGSVKK